MGIIKNTVRLLPGGIKLILPLAAALLAGACASFHSGDILVERRTLSAILEDKSLKPFSKIQVSWYNFPFTNPTDSIGEGSISNPKKIRAVPVPSEDLEYLRQQAKKILSEAGLYDVQSGSGTIKISLTTFGRWTYRDLFRSYLADTVFIFILPSTIRVNYRMTAEFTASAGTLKTELTACNKTTFHLLMAPLYPLFSPGAKGKGLLRQMLWRTCTEIYEKMEGTEYRKNDAGSKPDQAQNPAPDAGQNAQETLNPPPEPGPELQKTDALPPTQAIDD